jgi:peptidoglycan/xylan/chitin deacetylase (PgdA/CDA1 family)
LKNLLHDEGFTNKAELINLLEPVIPFKDNIKEKDYWLQMTQDEIRKLSASPFVTIGCHGYYHNDLSKISVNDAHNELVNAKRFLENITGKEINAIAFPYGSYTREVVAKAKLAGYNKLLATDFLFQEDYNDPYMRDRLTINPYISLNNQMIAIINGKYQ